MKKQSFLPPKSGITRFKKAERRRRRTSKNLRQHVKSYITATNKIRKVKGY